MFTFLLIQISYVAHEHCQLGCTMFCAADTVKDSGLLNPLVIEMGLLTLTHTFETTTRTVDFYLIFAMMWKIT
jgi:hypothetical protein